MNQLRSILFLDDNDGDRKLARVALEAESDCFEVIEAASSREFEDLLRNGSFDLVISEITVPGYELLQVLEAVQKQCPELPILILTGRGSEAIAVEAMRRGTSDYLKKTPENISSLPVTVKRIMGEVCSRSKCYQNNACLQKLIHNSVDMLAIIDEEGNEKFISDSVENILGYTAQEILGSNSFSYVHPDDLDLVRQGFAELLEKPGVPFRGNYRHRTKDGNWVYLEAVGTNYLDDPEIEGIVLNIRDITVHKQFEDSLKRSRAHLDKLVSNSNDILVIMDENGRELYVSETVEKVTGFSAEEVVGTVCLEHFHPDDVEFLTEKLREGIDNPGKPLRIEYRRKHKNGGWVYLEAIGTNFLDDPDIQGIVVNARDITERKKVEKGLRDSKERFRLLVSLLPEAVWEADLEGKLRFVNQKFLEQLGYTQADIEAGLNGFDIFAMPGRQVCMEKTMAVLNGAKTEITEYEMLRKDGTSFPALVHSDLVREDGKPTYFIGIGIDITEHKQAELERSRLAAAIEQSSETILITDREGNIQYVNPSFERITGYSRSEALGKNPRILKSGQQSENFYRSMWETLSSGKTWQGKVANKRRDGSIYHEDVTTFPVLNEIGEIVNYVAVKRDMTEQMKSAEEKLKLEQQYHQAQKLESVGLLAGGVAHDLNNLLTPILGYGEMLAMDSARPQVRKQYANGIVEAAKRARDIVNQLLAFSRKQSLEVKAVDLNMLVARFEELLRRLIPEDIGIKVELFRDLPLIRGDVSQLEQVIMNLAVNARDAMPNGGTLTIETALTEITEEFVATNDNLLPGFYATLVLSDTGLGMDARTKAKIFEPFFSTKPKHKGSGLGLATVYGIVRQHGGDIKVYSQPLKGTLFKVFLPVASGDPSSAENIAETDEMIMKGSETILMVEDDGHVRNLVLSILKRRGYHVLVAESAEQALEILKGHSRPVDLLLTDVVMPGLNGRELFDRISQQYPDMKVIYMSGYSGEVIEARGVMDEGMNFIQKPFAIQALASKIRRVLTE